MKGKSEGHMVHMHTDCSVGKNSAEGTRRMGQRGQRTGKKHYVEGPQLGKFPRWAACWGREENQKHRKTESRVQFASAGLGKDICGLRCVHFTHNNNNFAQRLDFKLLLQRLGLLLRTFYKIGKCHKKLSESLLSF